MTSLDTNLLLFAYDESSPSHPKALAFIESIASDTDVALSEFVLVEFYRLLRNPIVTKHPLTAPEAASVIEQYRAHPFWRIVSFPQTDPSKIHDQLWRFAGKPSFAYRRIYDVRLALTLQHFGVSEFATANTKDFEGLGFKRVWNPLSE